MPSMRDANDEEKKKYFQAVETCNEEEYRKLLARDPDVSWGKLRDTLSESEQSWLYRVSPS